MPVDALTSLLIILVVALVTYATRLLPFLLFPPNREIPKIVYYLGKVLTPAVIGMLVVYCLKNLSVTGTTHGLPEMLSVLLVIVLHVWKRNILLSIGAGTMLYMFLIQAVF